MYPKKNDSMKKILRNTLLIILGVALIGGAGVTLYIRNWYQNNLRAVSANSEVKNITITQGMGPKSIGSLLVSEGIIRNARAFETYVRGRGESANLKAGVFELSPSMTTQQVVDVLVSGKEASKMFTIGPGKRLDQISARLVKAGYTQTDVDGALNPELYKDVPIMAELPAGKSLEGFLFPETFQVTVSSTPQDIIRQSLTQLNTVITPQLRASFRDRGLSVFEAITLASIVEKEVPKPEDRKVVAQIFLKRLSEGTSLGSDATYFYASAVFGGEPFPTLDSPYNTRIYAGLPPGPINNVSKTALDAVANPAPTDYLFFVTGDDGVNHFTRTSGEHEEAVRQFCIITCAPGYIPPNE